MKTAIITFSPTGGTHKCAAALSKSLGENVQLIDLTDRKVIEKSNEKDTKISIADEAEIALIAVPSYGGRMPSLVAERLQEIDGRGKPAVLLCVYGNRAFEDTLVELEDVAKAQNFIPIAAVAAVAQHCMDEKIATDRPDAEDLRKLYDFGLQIAEKAASGTTGNSAACGSCPAAPSQGLTIPGNRPYKKAGDGMQPKTEKSCIACGLCSKNCPAAAISTDDPTKIDPKKCLGCMRCVSICPTKSKSLPSAKKFLVHTFLSLAAGKRKEPELYI